MKYLDSVKRKLKSKKICIFPMGIAAKALLDKLKVYGIEADFFSDSNKNLWGETYKGKECISIDRLYDMKEEVVVIIESLYYKQIKQILIGGGLNILRIYPNKFETDNYLEKNSGELNININNLKNILADERSKQIVDIICNSWQQDDLEDNYFDTIFDKNQYFDNTIFQMNDDEVFIDAGAYTGDTAEKFLKVCDGKFKEMHLFELDLKIFKRLENSVKIIQKQCAGIIKCYPFGLSDKEREVRFGDGDSNSTINEKGTCIGIVKALDDVLNNKKVTFIKMDIEGAELSALYGAREIIKKEHPKLAICIYHSAEDLFQIPKYIKELVPEYKLYIRHYTDMLYETVCYAIFDNKALEK